VIILIAAAEEDTLERAEAAAKVTADTVVMVIAKLFIQSLVKVAPPPEALPPRKSR
jgi:hypothetical protein